jgi:hypothetical protein
MKLLIVVLLIVQWSVVIAAIAFLSFMTLTNIHF